MKYLFIIVVHLTMTNIVLAQEITYPRKQDKSIVRVSGFYNGCGKIFDDKNYLIPTDAKSVIAPTVEDILQAEQMVNEKFTDLVKSDERLKVLTGKTYKKEYSEFYRQYVALINSEGDKVVFIHLIKCCKANIRKCFPDWEKVLGNPLDEDPCTVTTTYVANLSKKAISVY